MTSNESESKILSVIAALDIGSLKTLRRMIKHPDKREALIGLIDSTLNFQLVGVAQVDPPPAELTSEASADSIQHGATLLEKNEQKRLLHILLEDREALPTYSSVVKAINDAFRWGFKSTDTRSRKREAVVERVWQRLQVLPSSVRLEMINRLIAILPPSSRQNRDYHRLFSVLSRK